ncbi:hypothetical protein, partial [Deinococcus pimensis]|uniref:hypothetical protein n=1 Tax=Deinococcus pimensis TaxID=309888 RepID=UPI00048924DF
MNEKRNEGTGPQDTPPQDVTRQVLKEKYGDVSTRRAAPSFSQRSPALAAAIVSLAALTVLRTLVP